MPPVPRAVASSGLGEAGGAEAGHQLDPGAQRAGPVERGGVCCHRIHLDPVWDGCGQASAPVCFPVSL